MDSLAPRTQHTGECLLSTGSAALNLGAHASCVLSSGGEFQIQETLNGGKSANGR